MVFFSKGHFSVEKKSHFGRIKQKCGQASHETNKSLPKERTSKIPSDKGSFSQLLFDA